ncbi:MAG: nucleoside triphosphate pyrophosphohydrolase [Chloroflexi bacterium]|nr:nucleoside triphosphate pyrophosphohydrolase [Chloroflexota bacterium]
MITIVGLGPGNPGQITREAWQVLSAATIVHLRTRIHPTVPHLPEGPTYLDFDDIYEAVADFRAVYAGILERLIAAHAESDQVLYAVPGDPMVAESTVSHLLAVCREKNIQTRIISGLSFIEPTLAALGTDAGDGLQLLDALEIAAAYHPPINPDYPALIAQLYSRMVASDVKLTLMNQYPEQHPITLVHSAGTDQMNVRTLPLYELDRQDLAHLSSLYILPYDDRSRVVSSFEGFQDTIAHLRAPDGCPWDREQTHESLRPYVIEETFEVVDAIDSGDAEALKEELGDLLLQVVLHAQIAVEDDEFTMSDVIQYVDTKLKRRHPHVWGDTDVNGISDQVIVNWEAIKAQERAQKGEGERSILDGVARSMPALPQIFAYDQRAARVGFDWEDLNGVVDKVREELAEVLAAETPAEQFHEVGDLLAASAVLARWLKIDPEEALRAANRRFYERFTYVERRVRERGQDMRSLDLAELDLLWQEAKRNQKAAD